MGGRFDCHRWIFYSRPRAYIYTYYTYNIIYIWLADSPRRKLATEGPDYFCEAPTPPPPQFPRHSHCVCAQIILLFGPLCKCEPSDLCLIIRGLGRNAFPMSPNVQQSTPFYNGAVLFLYSRIITKCANAKTNKTRISLAPSSTVVSLAWLTVQQLYCSSSMRWY